MNERVQNGEFSRDLVPDGMDAKFTTDAENRDFRYHKSLDNMVTQLISFEFKMIDLNVERHLVKDLSEDSRHK